MKDLLDRLLTLPGALVYTLVTLVVFVEDALFFGFVLPGETAAILGGVAASLGHVSLPVMIALVVAAAIVGDTVGYEIGRRLGPRLLTSRRLRARQARLDRARELLARRGGTAVFLGRFTAFFRAVIPALAGASSMPYAKFLAFNAAGGLIWGAGSVLAGYLGGHSYRTVEKFVGRGTALTAVVIAAGALLIWRIRARRGRR
ncbi:membrane protein DedA, SNARE-associated domain [Micromonospora pattaloongensis]|uniref:Membrane protein DedA, SNARE-associated domain n=1 Tax=Micromonospora pattaloongensis TaxID=405436 RepID=A0A1H3NLQ7_9ACTN|nr:DedA family protein [Micromonospora pattaloongensis]SDY89897.1 membrane protein DedA, SNARE-associated domain [Micromonospora pattaloongensis]